MLKKILVSATLITAASLLTVAGCGGSSSSNNPGGGDSGSPGTTGGSDAGDGGTTTTTTPDGGGSTDGGSTNPNPLPDGAVLPSGTLLVPSEAGAVTLNGVTSDDFAIYTDSSSTPATVYALSLAAGSKPISLGPVDGNGDVVVVGKVVLIGTDGNKNGVGAVSIWTTAASASSALATSSCSAAYGATSGLFAVSADGAQIVYFDGVDTGCTVGTLTAAATDGTGKTPLVASVDLSGNYCYSWLAFGGEHAVAAYCVTGGDAGVVIDAGEPDGGTNLNVATLASFTGPSWTPVPIAVGVQPGIAVDPAGTKVVVVGPTGTLAYPIGGGTPVTIDVTGETGGVTGSPGLLVNDGGALVYTTTAEALERAATTAPPDPTQLVGAGKFIDLLGLSPDQNWVVGALTPGQNGQSDLYLASVTTAGSATTLSSATTSALQGDPFTTDVSHVLFFTGLSGEGTGTFNAAPVSSGTATALGTGAFGDLATSGAKVLFNANFDVSHYVADVMAVDTSGTAAPTVVVSLADPYVALNAEKTKILYTWSYQAGPNAGLWVLAAP